MIGGVAKGRIVTSFPHRNLLLPAPPPQLDSDNGLCSVLYRCLSIACSQDATDRRVMASVGAENRWRWVRLPSFEARREFQECQRPVGGIEVGLHWTRHNTEGRLAGRNPGNVDGDQGAGCSMEASRMLPDEPRRLHANALASAARGRGRKHRFVRIHNKGGALSLASGTSCLGKWRVRQKSG